MKTLNKKPMLDLIFDHLLNKGSITNVEAGPLSLPRPTAPHR